MSDRVDTKEAALGTDMLDLADEFIAQKKEQGEKPSWDLVRWAFTKGGVARGKMIYDWLAQVESGIEEDDGWVKLVDVLAAIPNTGEACVWMREPEWRSLVEASAKHPVVMLTREQFDLLQKCASIAETRLRYGLDDTGALEPAVAALWQALTRDGLPALSENRDD